LYQGLDETAHPVFIGSALSPMNHPLLIVPGYRGSGPDHWQSWLHANVAGSRRLDEVDWNEPILEKWSAVITRELDKAHAPVCLVAHSFGCLAALHAAARRARRVAGALLVAPADPDRFSPVGLRTLADEAARESIAQQLPRRPLPFPVSIVVSRNDPWIGFAKSVYLASLWGGRLIDAGHAGHINAASGYGPWPEIASMLRALSGKIAAELVASETLV